MSFIKDKKAYKTANLIAQLGNNYQHVANLFLRKAYGI